MVVAFWPVCLGGLVGVDVGEDGMGVEGLSNYMQFASRFFDHIMRH